MRKKTIVAVGTGADTKHDFGTLFAQYPAVIASLPQTFTSHQFILRLAQWNQKAYVEALYAYRDDARPFNIVHSILARHLHACSEVELVSTDAPSGNIFGEADVCAVWRKREKTQSK